MNDVTLTPTHRALMPMSARDAAERFLSTASRVIACSALSSDAELLDPVVDGSAVLATVRSSDAIAAPSDQDAPFASQCVASTTKKTALPVVSGQGQQEVAMNDQTRVPNMPDSEPDYNGSLLSRLRASHEIEELVAQIYLAELRYSTVQIGGPLGLDGRMLACALRCGEPFPVGPAYGWWTRRSTFQVAHPACVRMAETYGTAVMAVR